MSRSFHYRHSLEDVKKYLTEQGYQTTELYYRDGGGPFGFSVEDTLIEVDHDMRFVHPVTGDLLTACQGMVGLHNNPFSPGFTLEKAERSLNLYQKLYRRCRKPPPKA